MIQTRQCILEQPHGEIDLASWQEVVNLMASIYNASSGDIVQLRDDTFNVVATSNNPDNFLAANSNWPWDTNSFCRKMIETGDPLYVADAENSDTWKTAPPVCEGPVRSYLGYPLYWPNGDVFGSICVIDTKPTAYSNDFVTLLGQLKKLIEANLRHADDMEQVRHTALHDPLTGCGNRLLMEERLKGQIARVKRQNETFSLLSIDLNNFKPINDEFGHQVGDVVLQRVSERLQASIRESDLLVRTGGDEFLIIFSAQVNAQQTTKQLAAAMAADISHDQAVINISASFGNAICPDDGTSIDDLMHIVDQRMYADKRAFKAR